jgi:fructokinase
VLNSNKEIKVIMILVLGEILFDMFPHHRRIGGAPFNFAFHLKKLGFPVRFVSRVGADELGREILSFLRQHNFDLNDIQIDPIHDTGTVKVTLSEKEHAFTIIPDTAWAHIAFDERLLKLLQQPCELIYFGSLVQHSDTGFQLIQRVMNQKKTGTRVFCDINLRPDSYNQAVIKASLAAADVLKLNQDELEKISPETKTENHTAEKIMDQLMRSHELELMILTLGSQGSQWVFHGKRYQCDIVAQTALVDTVGAGDAYAAISAAGWLNRLPIEKIMGLASDFAGYICTIKGALPEDERIYTEFKRRIQKK